MAKKLETRLARTNRKLARARKAALVAARKVEQLTRRARRTRRTLRATR